MPHGSSSNRSERSVNKVFLSLLKTRSVLNERDPSVDPPGKRFLNHSVHAA